MVWRGLVRFAGAPILAPLAALLLTTRRVMAADPGCSVTVDPASAVDGSVVSVTGTVPDQPSASLLTLFHLLVVAFGPTGGAFLSRRLGAARSGPRH